MASPAQRPCCDVSRPCCDVSTELMDAIASEDWTEVSSILSESSHHVADSVVTQLISEDQWRAVRQIVECVRDEDRAWNIKGIIVKSSILLSVADRDWTCTRESPNKRFPDSTFQWIIQQACTRDTESEVVQFVLPHCADDRLDSVLTILVERRQWLAVGEVLVRGVSDSMKQWAVHETCEHCKHEDLRILILKMVPHCADDQEECVLTTLIKHGQWEAVREMPEKGVSYFKQWAEQEACQHWRQNYLATFYSRWNFRSQSYLWNHFPVDEFLVQDILPHCADDQLDSVLTTLVERRLWEAVLYVLKRGKSDFSKRWVVLEVCACCEPVVREQISLKIVSFCADDQADRLLTTLVERRQWKAVEKMLNKGVSDSNKQWAVREACKHYREYDLGPLVRIILRHCADDQMNSVLTTLVERRLWQVVLYVLERGVSNFSKRWLVLEMCACCESVEEYESSEILLFCADDQADCVLTTLVERRQWRAVGEMLKKGVSDSSKQWAVREACKHCKEYDFGTGYTRWRLDSPVEQFLVHEILSHCANDQLDSVLTTLIKRRLWWAVADVLKKGVDDKLRAIQEACKHCRDDDLGSFIHNILPHCADDQLDCVLKTLVERRLWQVVLYVLKRGVSDSSKRWVLLEVCACCESVVKQDISSEIVHFCADDQAESVVQGQILSEIFLFCADDQADCVLTTLVERRQWWAVGEMLKKGVNDSNKQWALQEACKHCKEYDFGTDYIRWRFDSPVEHFLVDKILSHCADDQLDSVLTTLVERRLWLAVLHVLKRGVSDSSKRWVILEVFACCEYVVKQDISSEIVHFCADNQLDSVLITLVERRQWRAVEEMLKKGVSDSNKQWAVREACKYCRYDDLGSLIQNILPHCADNQLDCVLTILVERRLWLAVGEVLKKGVSDSVKQWTIQEVCHYCKQDSRLNVRSKSYLWNHSLVDQLLVVNILPHCADDQLESVLTTLVERRLWHAVVYVLKRGVSDSSKRWVVLEVCACCVSVIQEHITSEILLFCADDQMDCGLTTLVERRLWKPMGELLQRGVSESQHRWAVGEASEAAESDEFCQFILPHCSAVERDSILSKFVNRHLWKPVGELLQRGGIESLHIWAVAEASKTAESDDFIHFILPHCSDLELDSVLLNLMQRHLWKPVGEVLQRGISETQCRCVFEVASKEAESNDFVQYILPHCSDQHLDSVLTNLAKLKKFNAVDAAIFQHVGKIGGNEWTRNKESGNEDVLLYNVSLLPLLVEHCHWTLVETVLHLVVMKSLCRWAQQGSRLREDESVLLTVVNSCRVNVSHSVKIFKVVKKEATDQVRKLHQHLGLTEDLCELFYLSLLHQVCVALCSDGERNNAATEVIENGVCTFYVEVISCMTTVSTKSTKGNADQIINIKRKMSKIGSASHDFSSNSVGLFLHVLQQFSLYYTSRRGDYDDNVFLMVFALLPFSSELQSVALRIMLRHKRWDVISQADLSGVWEQDRRHLLQAAVKQRQWSVVKRWADHTLYDDQRVWALNEALNEKQWDVALLLADHGLTDIDLMRVHYRLAKYADWDVILHMFERGADVAEVRERLGRMKDNKRISENSQRCIDGRLNQVRTLEKTIQNAKADAWENASRRCNWIFVLHTLLRNPVKESVHCALKVAMKKKAWHVVMQLVRVGMDAKQRHSLFSRMMKRQQWGVCRVLLEQGLSVQLCLKVLPQLMEMNQWALVARVMEHDVGDDVRQQVMQRAWERREGSVVWLCIKSLPTPLSEKEREALFQRAFTCEMWQVIKPLVEEKDETGIRHRDTALLEAIELHQWDLVDHCQRHHADINMKDDDGHTPLQRAAMKTDWEAVEELVVRDGDPNLMDREGYTVLHRAIEAKHWDIVNLLIQYHADIHKKYNSDFGGERVTPLHMLMDTRRADMIELSLLWCPDQAKGVNRRGETPLHVSCVAGCYDSIYYLIARGVPPLAVTNAGQSGLVYAVLNKDCPQRMVAECIRLGFSTHQPKLTNIETDQKCLMPHYPHGILTWLPENGITSPFLCAVLHNRATVMQMLYESGACNLRELFGLYTQLCKLADATTAERRTVQALAGHQTTRYQNFERCIVVSLPYLTEIATTPRSLVSTCRLVISHCLTLSKTRHRDVDQLPLTERMKNFVLFSDLTDPDFGKVTT